MTPPRRLTGDERRAILAAIERSNLAQEFRETLALLLDGRVRAPARRSGRPRVSPMEQAERVLFLWARVRIKRDEYRRAKATSPRERALSDVAREEGVTVDYLRQVVMYKRSRLTIPAKDREMLGADIVEFIKSRRSRADQA